MAAVALAGCGGMVGAVDGDRRLESGPPDTVAPAIAAFDVTPRTVGFAGGPVTIQAEVSDAGGVQSVWATITTPEATTMTLGLEKVTGQTYRGVWSAPSNAAQGAVNRTYTVRATASDAAGNAASTEAVTVTSTPPPAPPAPPITGG